MRSLALASVLAASAFFSCTEKNAGAAPDAASSRDAAVAVGGPRLRDVGPRYVSNQTSQPLALYVDDGNSGCSAGVNHGGPGGTAYTCAGGQVDVAK